MKKLRWQLGIIFLTGILVGILLLGEQSNEQPLSQEPVQGGTYSEALVGELQRLNPLLDTYNPVDQDIDSLIYSGLLKFDDRGMPVSDLTESWGVSQDGTIYNFTLRQGLLWHDGQPLTSRDVVFTIDLMREGGSIVPQDVQDFWEAIDVISLSDTSIQFRLPESFAPFPDYLTFGILPEHLLGNLTFDEMVDSPFNIQPIGSGPYRFESLILDGDRIIGISLSAFENYYAKEPFINQFIFRFYPDSTTAMQAYREGMVQGIGEVTDEILPDVLAEEELSLYSGRTPELYLILLNLNNPELPFFQEAEIRQALLKGLNRQWMGDRVMQGQAIIADGVVLPGTWAYLEEQTRMEFDVDQSILDLKQAGYEISGETGNVRQKDDIPFSFELIYPDEPLFETLAIAIQDNWAQINVQVNLMPVAYDELVNNRLQNRDFEAALISLNFSNSPDPDPYPFWDQAQATGGQNYTQWDNRYASEFIEQARITVDVNERARLYRNFQVIFNDELPALPLFYPIYNYAVDSQVQGVSMGPLFNSSDRFTTVKDWYLLTRSSSIGQ